MNSVIIKKENGNVSVSEIMPNAANKPYLTRGEKCFDGKIGMDSGVSNFNFESSRSIVYELLTGIDDRRHNELNTLYEALKETSNVDGLYDVLTYMVLKYKKTVGELKIPRKGGSYLTFETLYQILKEDTNLVFSTLIKKIVSSYCHNKIKSLTLGERLELAKANFDGKSIEELIGEKYSENSQMNGIKDLSIKTYSRILFGILNTEIEHLCWNDCKCASPNLCPKIRDFNKKTIDKYDFITDGYQLYNENGELENFVVTKCDNYVKQEYKAPDAKELARIKNLKDAIRMTYFDAETIEESYVIQHDLLASNKLTYGSGYIPSDKQIEEMRLLIKARN